MKERKKKNREMKSENWKIKIGKKENEREEKREIKERRGRIEERMEGRKKNNGKKK